MNNNGTGGGATPASDWESTKLMTLPSGNRAELKRASLIDLIHGGHIPDELGPLAAEMVTAQKDRPLTPEELKAYVDVVNLVVKASMVSPRAADVAGPETLAVTDIDWIDRVQTYKWSQGDVTTLRPFRPESKGKTKPFNAS